MLARPLLTRNGNCLALLFLAGRLQSAPLGLHEGSLAVLAAELAVGEEAFGADDLAVGEGGRGLLEAVGAHRAEAFIGDELTALFMVVVAVHEGVFLALPVEALELIGVLSLALLAKHALHVLAMRAAIRQSGMACPGGSM